MKPKLAALTFAMAGILAVALSAQKQNDDTATRSVQGVVTDSAGNTVTQAVVQLKDTKSLQIRSYRTDPDGGYHFAGLNPNVEYELKADADGASSGKKTVSVFNSQKSVTINLKLSK
jgi:hypothetical protein